MSFKIDVYSPVNATTQNINLNVIYLVVTSDFPLTNYLSANVSSSRDLNLVAGGLYSDQFYGGLQISIRENIKNLLIA